MTLQSEATSRSRWLGAMPKRFIEGRLSHVATAWTSNVDKHTVPGEPAVRLCNYTDVYKNDSITDSMTFMKATASPEQIARFTIRVGDTLITKDSETADDIGIPSYVRYEADDLICGYHLAIVRPDPRAADPRFLYWVMGSDPVLGQWGVQASGVTRVGIRSTDLAKVAIPIPPLAEQRAIANFLDEQTSRIDTLIGKQTQLIDTLRERASTVAAVAIQNATAPRIALRRLGRTGGGAGFPHEHQGRTGKPLPFYKVKALASADRRGVLGDAPDTVDYATAEMLGATVFPTGSIVYAKVGAALMLGRIRALPRPACIDNNLAAFVPGAKLNADYARHALTQLPFRALVNPGAVPSLSDRHILDFRVPLPSLSDQIATVSHLNKETSQIDALIDKAEEHIALAKERRAALITAAVTGQIDVRTAGRAGSVGA